MKGDALFLHQQPGTKTDRIPLRRGQSMTAIAPDDNLPGNVQHYGWGIELKLISLMGVTQGKID